MSIRRTIGKIIPKPFKESLLLMKSKFRYRTESKKADKLLKKVKDNIKADECPQIIKVGFVVQMPEIWDKEAPLFELMLNDSRFDPFLIVVPSYDFANARISEYGDEFNYFSNKYPANRIIKAFNGNWYDIESEHYKYVFFQRCWEHYLPKQYHTKSVIRYTKTCYIPYFTVGICDGEWYYKTSFFNYLYLCFCLSESQVNFHPQSDYRKIVALGAPVIDSFLKELSRRKDSDNHQTILWTPRWTESKEYGGSTFIKYLYDVLSLKEQNSNVDLVLRPHPLAFQNAIREGNLSEEEVERYKEKALKMGVVFDENKQISDTLLKTDILITDFSSIVYEYFLTGNPIIYCSDLGVDLEPDYRKIANTFYIANSWSEVEALVENLLSGDDPNRSERFKIIQEITKNNTNATQRILDYILSDAGEKGKNDESIDS